MTTNSTRARRAPAARILLLLAAVFALPIVLGSGLFWSGWRPEKSGNHGELLSPPRSLPATGLLRADGRALPTAELTGRWLLVLPVEGDCARACQERLQQVQQVHRALNRDQNRVRPVMIRSGVTAATAVQGRFPDLLVGVVPANATGVPWQQVLDDGSGQAVYVVDPMGNVILRYAAPLDRRGVLKDLERLLKYSWVG